VSEPSRPRSRQPRYGRFIVTGVALAAVVAAVVSAVAGDTGDYTRNQLFLYLLMAFGLVGGLAGGAVAVLLDGGFRRAPERPDAGAGDGVDRGSSAKA
jgi:hypothetical protein